MKTLNDFKTLNDLFVYITQNYSNARFLSFIYKGKWKRYSVREFKEMVIFLALGLKQLGVNKNSKLAIMAQSSPIWLMIDFATHLNEAVSVPIFFNISNENLEFELKDSQVDFMFLSTFDKLKTIKKHNIKKIITIESDIEDELFIDFEELIEIGKKLANEDIDKALEFLHVEINEENICSIIYTSGNTGTPKGVMLSHKNIISQVKDTTQLYDLSENYDAALSFLPLAHIFERMVMTFYLSRGISVYFADDVKNVSTLLQEIHPTLMTLVPRLLEKVYIKFKQKIDDTKGIKGLIARFAYEHARAKPPEYGKMWFEPILKKLVYKKFLDAFGGNIKMIISGGSSLNSEIYKFFINIGIDVYQGYGLTEFSPVVCANCPAKRRWGTCGQAFPSAQVKLSEEGELLAKGPSLMKGYLHQEDLTKEAIDAQGWLHTGDLAVIDKDGFISISGRKKELFKTSTGRYVSPIPIEQELSKSRIVDYGVVFADNRPYVVALLFLDYEMIEVYKKFYNINQNIDFQEFRKLPRVKKELSGLIKRVNRKLDKWQKIADFKIIDKALSIEDGELTPSMKVRRAHIEKLYKTNIDGMYQTKDML